MKYFTQEAIMTALCQHCDSHIEMCEECGMREIIESVPSAWISVKDRLPEDGKNVLAYDSESGSIDMAYYSENEWFLEDLYEIEYLHPTHWMRLPDAPEMEGKEQKNDTTKV
jgi:hypothetical protein